MIKLGQGKRPVSSVLVFGMLIRSRPTIPWEISPDPHKKFYGVHFLASSFSAISPVLSGFLSLLFSVQQPKGTCSCDWVTSGVQMRRGRRKRKKKEGEGGLALPLGTAALPNEKCKFSSLGTVAPAVFHISCLLTTAPTTELPGVWGEQKWRKRRKAAGEGWFPQLSVSGVPLCNSSQTKRVFLSASLSAP